MSRLETNNSTIPMAQKLVTTLVFEQLNSWVFSTFGIPEFLVCVTEQHYVSRFFTRLWSVRKALLYDTQNPEISGFSTAHACKYKTKQQEKMKQR